MNELARAFPDIAALRDGLNKVDYLADPGLATALFCAIRLSQPVLLEGEPGVGKTEAAKALSLVLKTPLVRLQCYEGINASEAVYEWNYPRQLLGIRLAERSGEEVTDDDLFSEHYLIERPLLRVLRHSGPRPAVLLIDEVDRSDDEFEAFLLELLGEATLTIPELGTFRAAQPPIVVLTSNRTRDLHDALKRRCIYHWIDYPTLESSIAILRRRVPSASITLLEQAARTVRRLREIKHIQKAPGIAETINWVHALELLGITSLDLASAEYTLGSLLKYREDQDLARESWGAIVTNDRSS